MISLTAMTRIYLYRGACDMRKSFDGLCGIIRSELDMNPLSGSLFVFVNGSRRMVKLLYWDQDGLVLWYKRLEATIASQAALLAQKDVQIEQLLLKYESLQRQHTTLQHQIEQLIRRIYGRKSEKIDPNQLMFDSIVQESLAQSAAIAAKKEKEENTAAKTETETTATVPAKSRKERTRHGRLPIPEHLERVEIIIDIPEDEKVSAFTGEPLKVIGVEVSEKLESQNFCDHFGKLDQETVTRIGDNIAQKAIELENIPLDAIVYDTSNYYNYLDVLTPSELSKINPDAIVCGISLCLLSVVF